MGRWRSSSQPGRCDAAGFCFAPIDTCVEGVSMDARALSRRELLLAGGAAVAGVALLRLDRLVAAVPLEQGEEVLPWLD